jgi:hypothetical protein
MSSEKKDFNTPVVIEPGRLGRFRVIRNPQEALEALSGRWPDCDGEKLEKALEACGAADAGQVPAHLARRSFVAAARSAKILVTPEDSRRYTRGDVDLAKVDG